MKEYDPSLIDEAKAIPIEDMVERLYGLTIEYHYIRNNGRILGETGLAQHIQNNSRYLYALNVRFQTFFCQCSECRYGIRDDETGKT